MNSAYSLKKKPSASKVVQLLCLVSVAAISLTALFAEPSFAASKAILSSVQNGSNIEVRWSVSNATPSFVDIKLVQAGKVTKAVRVKASLKKVTLKSVQTGFYTLQLTSTKPKLSVKKNITVFGAPLAVRDLTFKRGSKSVSASWVLPEASKLTHIDRVELVSTVGGVSKTVFLPADLSEHTFPIDDPASTYTISVRTVNRYGTSLPVSVSVVGVDDARGLTSPRLISQNSAEDVFGSFALMNRSPLGPVDLESSTVAAENPALGALQKCVTTGTEGRVDIQGLPNVGGVWATRTSSGTMILTSGASALLGRSGSSWIETNPIISSCAYPALLAQLNSVALQLSATSKVEQVTSSPFDVSNVSVSNMLMAQGSLLQGKVYLNGGSEGEVAQSIQLYWVAVGSGETINQYILVKVGVPIDESLVGRFTELIVDLNS